MQPSPARVAKAGGGTPAPYGHACTNCVKAKCKCMYGDHGGACERCFRLHKDCQPSVPNRKRSQKKAAGSRTAHLEEKLDDLVSLIRSQAAVKGHNGSPPVPTPASMGRSASDATALPSSSLSPGSSPNAANASATAASELDHHVPEEEAQERLDVFRRDFPQFGPVVYIPPGVTAKELHETRPTLWIAIMACTTRSTKEAHAIGDKVRHIVSEKVVRQCERNLDLLQGLLVFLCWPHSHKRENPFIATWTGLGVAMAHDLGLTAVKTETAFTYMKKFAFHGMKQPHQTCKEPTMETRRTLLGLYAWCNTVSQMMRRDNSLRWTPHMEETLRLFMEQPECEGDKILSVQVRCALISDQINDLLTHQSLNGESQTSPYFIRALDGQLQDIWRTLPEIKATHHYDTMLLHLYATEVMINELAIQHTASSAAHPDVMFRLGRMQKCLRAVHGWFDSFDRTPPPAALGGTFHLFVQMVTCLTACIKLHLAAPGCPAWEADELRRRLDVPALFDRIAARMERTRAAVGIREDDDREESIWARSAKIMGMMKAGVQAEWAAGAGEPTPAAAGPAHAPPLDGRPALPPGAGGDAAVGAGLTMSHEALAGEFVPSFGEDPWLSAMFIPWDAMNF